jgi:hypothetical protein
MRVLKLLMSLYILRLHLNHPANAYIIGMVAERTQKLNPSAFRMLKLFLKDFFNPLCLQVLYNFLKVFYF